MRFAGAMLHSDMPENSVDAHKTMESTQFARKLYQAVLTLKPGETGQGRQVHRMARALAIAENRAAQLQSGNAS